MAAPPPREGPRINDEVTSPTVRLIDQNGQNVGTVAIERALALAAEVGFDLVEISPNAEPPVCRLLDYGRYKYEAQKKAADARKKQKVIGIKEIKLRPGIDEADYQVKLRSIIRFLNDGDKVKVTMRFRGREMVHQEIGINVLKRVEDDLVAIAKVEQTARLEGRQMTMVVTHR